MVLARLVLLAALAFVAVTAAAQLPPGAVPEISPDGKRVLAVDGEGSIGIFDARSLALVSRLKKVVAPDQRFLSFSPSGKLLFVWGGVGSVHDAATGRRLFSLKGLEQVNTAWFSEAEDRLFAFGKQSAPAPKPGWALMSWSIPTGKVVHTEPLVGASGPPLHPSTGRSISTRDAQRLYGTDGRPIVLGSGKFGCIAASPGLVVFTWRKKFMEPQQEPLTWVDPAKPDERHPLAAIATCSNAYLDPTGKRLLVQADRDLTLWDLSDRSQPKVLARSGCGLLQDVAVDLSFALCGSGIAGEPVSRIDLHP